MNGDALGQSPYPDWRREAGVLSLVPAVERSIPRLNGSRLILRTAAGMATAGRGIQRAWNGGAHTFERKGRGRQIRRMGTMGVLSRNAEALNSKTCLDRASPFLNHAGGDSTDKRLQTWFGVIKQSMVNHDDPNPNTRACSSFRHTEQ